MGNVAHKDLTGTNLHEPKPHAASHTATGSDPVVIGTFAGPDCASLVPTADNVFDLGSAARRFNDAYLGGTMYGQDVKVLGAIQDGTYQHTVNDLYVRRTRDIGIIFSGGGSVIPTGIAGDLVSDVAGTILQWTFLGMVRGNAAGTGSITVDIWKDTYANYPPAVADTICGTHPFIADGYKGQDANIAGWNTQIAAGDILRFNVDSASGLTQGSLILKVRIS